MSEVREIAHGGFTYRYRMIRGRGRANPLAVIIGGALQNMYSWGRFVDGYHRHMDVLVCDLPGAGESDLLPHSYPFEFLADCLKKVLDREGAGQVALQSASYATPIAYTFAAKFPEKVSHVAMASTMREIPEAMLASTGASIKYVREGALTAAADVFTSMFTHAADIDLVHNGRVAQRILLRGVQKMNEHARAIYVANTRRLLEQPPITYQRPPKVPFLVFTGEYDPYTRPCHCREVAASLPRAVFTTVKEADHLVHLERSETAWQLLYQFFTDRPLDAVAHCSEIERFGQEDDERAATQ